VRALVQAGAAYYSDEYAVLDESGNVLPYPRRLSIRASGGAPARHAHVSELGGVVGSAPTTVGTVAITRFRPGSVWSPQPVSRGAGALALLENTVPARARPQAALQAITQALSGARVLIGDRGEADATARALIQVIAS
jgi:hypothetical protein